MDKVIERWYRERHNRGNITYEVMNVSIRNISHLSGGALKHYYYYYRAVKDLQDWGIYLEGVGE